MMPGLVEQIKERLRQPMKYQPSVPCFLNVGGGAKGWHNNRAFSFPGYSLSWPYC